MGLFGKSKKEYESENEQLKERVKELEDLCEEKDDWFKSMMSDALRNGSSMGGKQMAERKKYLQGK